MRVIFFDLILLNNSSETDTDAYIFIFVLLSSLLTCTACLLGPLIVYISTWGCCTASLDRWLRSHSFVSRQTRTTTLTIGHAGASGPRHPVSHTGPYDTTGEREWERGRKTKKEGGTHKQRATCHKSVRNTETFQWTLPFFFFMMTVCQNIEQACKI